VERLLLVHGSVLGGAATWRQQRPLSERFELVVVQRPGFPPGPAVERVDFEPDAELVAGLLEPGDHLVGHSYGGVISLLAAARRPDGVRSLTVVEPPATRVAPDDPAVGAFAAGAEELWATGPKDDPEAFLRSFLAAVGSDYDPPSPLPPELEQGARTLIGERPPTEAEIPLAALAAAPFPKLVVSGAHHPAFDAICDVLERELRAERAVLPGHGHSVQRHPDFNGVLADFVERATGAAPKTPSDTVSQG
jgi:pimeloyl-ACP methyl ester carboxylesterase